jgi:hypothetical protein
MEGAALAGFGKSPGSEYDNLSWISIARVGERGMTSENGNPSGLKSRAWMGGEYCGLRGFVYN